MYLWHFDRFFSKHKFYRKFEKYVTPVSKVIETGVTDLLKVKLLKKKGTKIKTKSASNVLARNN